MLKSRRQNDKDSIMTPIWQAIQFHPHLAATVTNLNAPLSGAPDNGEKI